MPDPRDHSYDPGYQEPVVVKENLPSLAALAVLTVDYPVDLLLTLLDHLANLTYPVLKLTVLAGADLLVQAHFRPTWSSLHSVQPSIKL